MGRLLVFFCVILVVSACQGLGGDDSGDNQSSGNAEQRIGLVQWNRDPYYVIFQAEIAGGTDEDAFFMKNDVPLCTVYGDGRVVWIADADDGNTDILFDFLSDEEIIDFVSYLTIQERIYTYKAMADYELPQQDAPVVELLTLQVNDTEHQTDAFAGWPPEYFARILETCQTLSPTPTRFEPSGAWLSTSVTFYDPTIPEVFWDSEAAGLSLLELAEENEVRWIDGSNLLPIWQAIRTSSPDVQFSEDGVDFHVALQIPGVTHDAPPAP